MENWRIKYQIVSPVAETRAVELRVGAPGEAWRFLQGVLLYSRKYLSGKAWSAARTK